MPEAQPPCDKPEFNTLSMFSKQIQIILQTVNENEFQAAIIEMKPPTEKFKSPVVFKKTSIVLGMFGRNKVALIQTDPGSRAYRDIEQSIEHFPNAKFVIGVGVCYAFDNTKHKLGDVLVASRISDLVNLKFQGNEIINRGETISVARELREIFCRFLTFQKDYPVSDTGRTSKVYSGVYASYPALVNDKSFRDKFLAAVPEVIGGEMEGGELLSLHQEGRIQGVIIIKAVVDYGDGQKSKEWQFTSARAALNYTKSKLDLVPFDDPGKPY